jgi:hypothetical protein
MGHQSCSVNYKNEVLIQIWKFIFPNDELAWQAVAIAYQEASSKEKLRDWDDIKKHLIKNLCNGMKKPTGSMGGMVITPIHALLSKKESWIRHMRV